MSKIADFSVTLSLNGLLAFLPMQKKWSRGLQNKLALAYIKISLLVQDTHKIGFQVQVNIRCSYVA